jgi:hypothetical protein
VRSRGLGRKQPELREADVTPHSLLPHPCHTSRSSSLAVFVVARPCERGHHLRVHTNRRTRTYAALGAGLHPIVAHNNNCLAQPERNSFKILPINPNQTLPVNASFIGAIIVLASGSTAKNYFLVTSPLIPLHICIKPLWSESLSAPRIAHSRLRYNCFGPCFTILV